MSADAQVKSRAQFAADAELASPYPRASLWLRLGARLADLGTSYGIFLLGGRAGAVLAILYILLADGIFEGQSIGKKIFGIRVVHLPTRSSGRKRDSTLRNAPLALPLLLWMMPEGLGMIAFVAGAIVIGVVEAWQTQVVDGKVVAGAAAGLVARERAAVTERAAGRITLATRVRRSVQRRRRRSRCGSL
jgi:hypothetical protein